MRFQLMRRGGSCAQHVRQQLFTGFNGVRGGDVRVAVGIPIEVGVAQVGSFGGGQRHFGQVRLQAGGVVEFPAFELDRSGNSFPDDG